MNRRGKNKKISSQISIVSFLKRYCTLTFTLLKLALTEVATQWMYNLCSDETDCCRVMVCTMKMWGKVFVMLLWKSQIGYRLLPCLVWIPHYKSCLSCSTVHRGSGVSLLYHNPPGCGEKWQINMHEKCDPVWDIDSQPLRPLLLQWDEESLPLCGDTLFHTPGFP